jgi:hypothetical protein
MSRGTTDPRRDAAVARLWSECGCSAIARQLRTSRQTVWLIARRLHLPPQPRPFGRKAAPPCGTTGAYARGCRCERCRTANREYHRRHRSLASRLMQTNRPAPTGHGSLARAKAGCDCPRCTRALQDRTHPNGPPMWRCDCNPYRLNAGDLPRCGGCNAPSPWATHQDWSAR